MWEEGKKARERETDSRGNAIRANVLKFKTFHNRYDRQLNNRYPSLALSPGCSRSCVYVCVMLPLCFAFSCLQDSLICPSILDSHLTMLQKKRGIIHQQPSRKPTHRMLLLHCLRRAGGEVLIGPGGVGGRGHIAFRHLYSPSSSLLSSSSSVSPSSLVLTRGQIRLLLGREGQAWCNLLARSGFFGPQISSFGFNNNNNLSSGRHFHTSRYRKSLCGFVDEN